MGFLVGGFFCPSLMYVIKVGGALTPTGESFAGKGMSIINRSMVD